MKFPIALIPHGTNFDFMGYRKFVFAFSLIMTLIIPIMIGIKGLNLGIDFTGGVIVELQSSKPIDLAKLRTALSHNGHGGGTLQGMNGDKIVLLRTKVDEKGQASLEQLKHILLECEPEAITRRVDYVGPKVGQELSLDAVYAISLAIFVIICYVGYRFNWQFGVGAVLALLHDVVATLGFYLISGYEFDLNAVAALLTIVGYSINDTVVIYDRIRDNMAKYRKIALSQMINLSINETLSRTLMTVLTTAVVCIALVAVGGHALRSFSAAVLFGILFGTYSSIFISAPILLYTGITSTTIKD